MGQAKEITIADEAPGAAPGLSFADVIKYLPLIQELIAAVAAGAGSFVLSIKGRKFRITVEPA